MTSVNLAGTEDAAAGEAYEVSSTRQPKSTPVVSVLFPAGGPGEMPGQAPDFFEDLHLDQIVATVTADRDEYQLEPFFWCPLRDAAAVLYRHELIEDLKIPAVREAVYQFASEMREVRRRLGLSHKVRHDRQRDSWLLAALARYCDAVAEFERRLADAPVSSQALLAVADYLAEYAHGSTFTALSERTGALEEEVAELRYTIHTKGARVTVDQFEDQPDMTADVRRTFAKFKQGPVTERVTQFREYPELNHVEAQILDRVAALFPDTFAAVRDHCERHRTSFDETIVRFDREIQFYLAYLEHGEKFEARGLAFALPGIVADAKRTQAREAFDLSLAESLVDGEPVVRNDISLTGEERVLVITGPNQGGKTTFARMFGQLHYLASLGLPVPASSAELPLADRLFTHFEREERLETLRGKFEDDLVRIHEILARATGESILVMNESFGSTTLRDALAIGTVIVKRIIALDALCVFVTFIDELASLSEATVSMMSLVDPDDPATRTFAVERKPADGLAYATALAEKYGLTDDAVRRRIAR